MARTYIADTVETLSGLYDGFVLDPAGRTVASQSFTARLAAKRWANRQARLFSAPATTKGADQQAEGRDA